MPVLDSNVNAWLECGLELPVLRGTLQVVQPVLIAEPHQPLRVAAQRFGKASRRNWSSSWMMLLDLRGLMPMISLAAATAMAMPAAVLASMLTGAVALMLQA